jgi:hypothetical protein
MRCGGFKCASVVRFRRGRIDNVRDAEIDFVSKPSLAPRKRKTVSGSPTSDKFRDGRAVA